MIKVIINDLGERFKKKKLFHYVTPLNRPVLDPMLEQPQIIIALLPASPTNQLQVTVVLGVPEVQQARACHVLILGQKNHRCLLL